MSPGEGAMEFGTSGLAPSLGAPLRKVCGGVADVGVGSSPDLTPGSFLAEGEKAGPSREYLPATGQTGPAGF